MGQLFTLYFLRYLCPLPFISCLAGLQGPLCHLGYSHINLWPEGAKPPSPSSSFIFWVSVRPSGSCPGARRALLVPSSDRTIVRGPWDYEVRQATGRLSGAQESGDLSRIISIMVGCSGLAVRTSKSWPRLCLLTPWVTLDKEQYLSKPQCLHL